MQSSAQLREMELQDALSDAQKLLRRTADQMTSQGIALQEAEAQLQAFSQEVADLRAKLEAASSQLSETEGTIHQLQVSF